MGPAADKIASLMGPPDRQGHGATPKDGSLVFARVMGPVCRQGHGASMSPGSWGQYVARVMGPVCRQGHGATPTLAS